MIDNMSLDSLLMSSHVASEDVSAWLFGCGHWHWPNTMLSSKLNKTHDILQMALQAFRRTNLLSALVDGAVLDFWCFASFVEAGCWEARNAKHWGYQWWTVHGHRYDRYVKSVFCLQLLSVDLWWDMNHACSCFTKDNVPKAKRWTNFAAMCLLIFHT